MRLASFQHIVCLVRGLATAYVRGVARTLAATTRGPPSTPHRPAHLGMSRDLKSVEVLEDFEDIALVDERRVDSANGDAERSSSSAGLPKIRAWFNSVLRGQPSSQGFQPLRNIDDASPRSERAGVALLPVCGHLQSHLELASRRHGEAMR